MWKMIVRVEIRVGAKPLLRGTDFRERKYSTPSYHIQRLRDSKRWLWLVIQIMPPVSSVITPALLSSIRAQPHLPHHAWYFVTGVTLSVLNLPHEIPHVFRHAIDKGPGSRDSKPEHDEQLEIARKMREALVKAAPIGGLPKVPELHHFLTLLIGILILLPST